jgi:hypothetical protein
LEARRRNGRWLAHNRNVRSALMAVSTFVLIFLVALGANRSFARVGTSEGVPGAQLAAEMLFFGLLGFLTTGLCLAAYFLLRGAGPRRRGKTPEQVRDLRVPWWIQALVVLAILLLVAAVVAAIVLLRGEGQETPPAGAFAPPLPPANGVPAVDPASVAVAQWSFLGALAVSGLAGVVLLVLRRRRAPAGPSLVAAAPGRQELRDVVQTSLDDLEHEPDARRAVIRAYISMEQVLAEHGLGRRPYEAPVEYLTRWLACLGVSRSAGERLTGLFQRARFSAHVVDSEMKRDAIEALVAFRNELAGEGQ